MVRANLCLLHRSWVWFSAESNQNLSIGPWQWVVALVSPGLQSLIKLRNFPYSGRVLITLKFLGAQPNLYILYTHKWQHRHPQILYIRCNVQCMDMWCDKSNNEHPKGAYIFVLKKRRTRSSVGKQTFHGSYILPTLSMVQLGSFLPVREHVTAASYL